ncbi:uncharacterized protein LOC111088591 isoform X2 [Limulus polyphemus]|nr:uncharacterized protein LOC111088591 isoform X2 [Limulus polyphemus]
MDQVRELMNHCSVPSTSDATATTVPGPGGAPSAPPVPVGCLGNRMLSRNVNGTGYSGRMYGEHHNAPCRQPAFGQQGTIWLFKVVLTH